MANITNKDEFNAFKNADDIVLTEIKTSNSVKTNIFIAGKNFTSLVKYLATLKSAIVYIFNLIDIDTLIKNVIDALQLSKNLLFISYEIAINQTIIQSSNNKNYQIKRLDDYIIEITNNTTTTWNVDNLIVQVKDISGTIVYPVIVTKNNSIKIHFIDGLKTDYNVFFI